MVLNMFGSFESDSKKLEFQGSHINLGLRLLISSVQGRQSCRVLEGSCGVTQKDRQAEGERERERDCEDGSKEEEEAQEQYLQDDA